MTQKFPANVNSLTYTAAVMKQLLQRNHQVKWSNVLKDSNQNVNRHTGSTKRSVFFWTVRISHRLFFKMNLDIVGTHSVNTVTLNGNVWLLLLPVSLILTFYLLAFLEGHLNGAML